MDKKIRTRIAPSPTGAAHIGNIRTALFNYLFAKKHGGEFLLRIEDTDKNRFVSGAEKYIIDSLLWLGIKPDDGINSYGTARYRQSERDYKSFVDLLIANGHAYYAFDSTEELSAMKTRLEASGSSMLGYAPSTRMSMKNSFTLSPNDLDSLLKSNVPYVVRFNTPINREIKFIDSVKGEVTFSSNDMDDKVLFKSNGLPAYHLANVVDDHLMEITHVIRGDEWLSSTPLHILLYEAFGWDKPVFCHLPLILGPDGKKLSKRHGDKYGFPVFPMTWDYVDEDGKNIHVTGFKDENYEPDALINFLALLGWNPGGDKEIMSIDEMISLFSIEGINNSGAIFDIDKLKSFNAHYLRSRSNEFLFGEYIEKILDEKSSCVEYSWNQLDKIMSIAKVRATFNSELYSTVSYFFEPVILKDNVILKNDSEFRTIMNAFIANPCNRVMWTSDGIKNILEGLCEKSDFKIGKIMPDLRMALTGGIPGPDLPLTMEILGPDESFGRISSLLMKTEKVAN